MMLPNNFNVTPFVLGDLKPQQRSFVEFLHENGHTNPDEVVFKRNYLKNIAQAWGAEWAPAWIVKDVSRVTKRGFYAIPELTELINLVEMATAIDDEVDAGMVVVPDESLEVSDDMVGDLDETLSVADDVEELVTTDA